MSQRTLWSDTKVRQARQARAEAFMGQPMVFGESTAPTVNGGAAEAPGARMAVETMVALKRPARRQRR